MDNLLKFLNSLTYLNNLFNYTNVGLERLKCIYTEHVIYLTCQASRESPWGGGSRAKDEWRTRGGGVSVHLAPACSPSSLLSPRASRCRDRTCFSRYRRKERARAPHGSRGVVSEIFSEIRFDYARERGERIARGSGSGHLSTCGWLREPSSVAAAGARDRSLHRPRYLNETCGDPWPVISPRVAAAVWVLRPTTASAVQVPVGDNYGHQRRRAATSEDTPGPAAITAITCRSVTSSRPPRPQLSAAVGRPSPRRPGASRSTGRVLNPVTFYLPLSFPPLPLYT